VFGDGIREPLRVRAGWVPDETIKALERFVAGPVEHDTRVMPFPLPAAPPAGSARRGGAA
jgi:DNA segregation ATPase FtsK/SpoIIIE, S-DNA-T family